MRCPECLQKKQSSAPTCPLCGFNEVKLQRNLNLLPTHTLLRQGRYELGKVLGQGGFGVTYKAFDNKIGAEVVIKECFISSGGFATRLNDGITITVSDSSETERYKRWLKNFQKEAELLRRSRHPYIVDVIDFFLENNTAYSVMPFVQSTTLEEYVRGKGTKPKYNDLQPIMLKIVSALANIHKQGITHRDLKPNNILIDENGDPVMIDFGAARIDFTASASISHMSVNCPAYSPIEQVNGSTEQGQHSDIYALSVSFYQLLTGVLPPKALDRALSTTDPYVPIERMVEVPPAFAKMINQGMSFRPEKRQPNAQVLLEQFTKISNGLKPVKTKKVNESVSTPSPEPILKPKSSKFGVGFFIIMLVVLVVLFLFLGPLGLGMGIIGSAMLFVVKAIMANKDDKNKEEFQKDESMSQYVSSYSQPVMYFISGPRQGETVELRQGRTVIGSTDNNDIKISSPLISRNHLAIHVDEKNILSFEDVGSKNGTFCLRCQLDYVYATDRALPSHFDFLRVESKNIVKYISSDSAGFFGGVVLCLGPVSKDGVFVFMGYEDSFFNTASFGDDIQNIQLVVNSYNKSLSTNNWTWRNK